ncbi:immunoglobulin-like domain-containing protein [Staphylococcus cornubiensis]|uniref:immunoglobulin-like domain-containing protein n=1 Tax=Staphylococcus cornubiensis TaxID=1986155 RepID=UPI000A3B8EDD|nr:immunoglobulin-like domain-containing protein [Staphylococcus cornubiensis]
MNKLLQSLSALGVSATLVSPNLNVEATTNTVPSIKGVEDSVIKVGEDYNPYDGVIAYDKEDGDLTDKIKVNGHLDTTKQGIYTLQYEVTDSDGAIETSSRTIKVVDAPSNE